MPVNVTSKQAAACAEAPALAVKIAAKNDALSHVFIVDYSPSFPGKLDIFFSIWLLMPRKPIFGGQMEI